MSGPQPTGELKHTPLHALHVRLGGRMVAFAGYDMPVQYSSGIIKEHLHTRTASRTPSARAGWRIPCQTIHPSPAKRN